MEIHPQVAGFVLFCVNRRGNKWPGLYDEMCRVAGRGLYQGLHCSDLKSMGLSFSLNHIDETIKIVEAVANTNIDANSLDSEH